ncbi:hypothetical protein CROQUDRAFT_662587 [Cronartium quercuum f. sp. fusiforme G11]|uniref:Uncharacterized protein n=1 Tax=Cronartium quercuum f. sp. fusiforme G11 TaxID=708437 RepID=A0A9P6T8B6_9BASI|nr:hypothetical protein CROQUDRAFT_662587 [Cronartium quercuum f. sp. fusiforme G11]
MSTHPLPPPKKRKTTDEPSPEILPVGTTARSLAAASSEKHKKKETVETTQAEFVPSRPTFDFPALPPSAIHRYLLFHQLIPSSALTYDHAVFPTRPLTLPVKQEAATIATGKSHRHPAHKSPGPMTLTSLGPGGALSFLSIPPAPPPSANELRNLSAFDDAEGVLGDRLANLARTHWEKQPTTVSLSRENEIIAGFVYAVKTRGKALRRADR